MSNFETEVNKHLKHWFEQYSRDGDVRSETIDSDSKRLERAERCLRLMAAVWSHDPTIDVESAKSKLSGTGALVDDVPADLAIALDEADPRFGRLRIRRQLGCGGQAVVFQAYDPELGRDVALKIPHPQWLTTTECRTRFVQECQILAQLSHPNLATVFEATTDEVLAWMICEYCHGPSLASWLKDHDVAHPSDAAALITQLAQAVDYVHKRGIVHRDIKPGNILLVPKGDSPANSNGSLNSFSAKLTDFGLAKVSSNPDMRTRTGAILGTPAYMSPEQLQGRRNDVGPRTDVYSLGAVLYEMLTGRAPSRGRTELELLTRVVAGDIVPPRQVRRGIPPELEAICLKCLDQEIERRYASAMDLARDLDRFLAHEPVTARPPRRLTRAGKWIRRNSLVSALCATIAVCLLTGFGVATWQKYQVHSQYLRADRSFGQALAAVTSFHEMLYDQPQADAPEFSRLRMSMTETALRYYDELLEERPNDPTVLRASSDAYRQIAFTHLSAGRNDDAIELYEKVLTILKSLTDTGIRDSEIDYYVAQTNGRIALALNRQGHLEQALRRFGVSRQIGRQLMRDDPTATESASVLAECLLGMLSVYEQLGQLDNAFEVAQEAIVLRKQIVAQQPENAYHRRELANTYREAAVVFLAREQFDRAVEACSVARGIQEQLVDRNEAMPWSESDLAKTMRLLAEIKKRQNEPQHALQLYTAACQQLKLLCQEPALLQALGTQLGDTLTELANLHGACGQLDAAIANHQHAREVYTALTENDQRVSKVMRSNLLLGQLYQKKQLPREAAEHFWLVLRTPSPAGLPPKIEESTRHFRSTAEHHLNELSLSQGKDTPKLIP